jgi:predicted phosphate transport protein (TIGR00153 family)
LTIPICYTTGRSIGIEGAAMKLFDIFLRKQRSIEQDVFSYLSTWKKCLEYFKGGMEVYLAEGIGEKFDYYVQEVTKAEERADELRRTVEWQMYAKALIPESRGDILGFLETMDKIPNKAESLLNQIRLQKLQFPQELNHNLERIVTLSCEAIQLVYEAATKLISKNGDIHKLADEIDAKETECDHAEQDTIAKIFSMDMEKADKILLKEFIVELGNLTDRAEDVSDRLTIFSVKRRV